jgi:hypothetical protein
VSAFAGVKRVKLIPLEELAVLICKNHSAGDLPGSTMGRDNMSRTGSTSGQRAAVYLLVLCLATAALFHFASQTLPHTAGAPGQLPGISAPGGEIALVLGNKTENPVDAELQSAVFSQLDSLRFFGGGGGPLPGAKDTVCPTLFASSTEIRGPPPTPQS